jgi:hypothetical protein
VKRAIAVAVAVAVAAVVAAVVLVSGHNGPVDSVADLDTGDCVDAPGYLEGRSESLRNLERVDCDDAHDGEVLFAGDLSATEAAAYRDAVPNEVCVARINRAGTTAINDMALLLAGATDRRTPRAGDALACLAFKADGSRLDGRVVTR